MPHQPPRAAARGDLVDPPEYMADGAQQAWRYAIESAPEHLLRRLDMSVLEVWSCAADLYRKAQIGIIKTGLLIKAPNTGVPMQSPYLAIANKQAQIMTKAATEMGFTPASRSRITLPADTAGDADPWADIAG